MYTSVPLPDSHSQDVICLFFLYSYHTPFCVILFQQVSKDLSLVVTFPNLTLPACTLPAAAGISCVL